jgi:hypothetical protein
MIKLKDKTELELLSCANSQQAVINEYKLENK